MGSSPHTRGAPPVAVPARVLVGIIPAYAGSTSTPRRSSAGTTDHPRIRGEHVPGPHKNSLSKGSSPHTRGAPQAARHRRRDARIIPAYAGSTIPAGPDGVDAPDHPRIRGEHLSTSLANATTLGSSPHTRGARLRRRPDVVGARIIPAYAGSTLTAATSACATPDHPRIRGEHSSTPFPNSTMPGSSPHTRGARTATRHRMPRRRISPAYAGSTALPWTGGIRPWDHPRIRGEHSAHRKTWKALTGSSPHTRGARTPTSWIASGPRIIPAYAGSTKGASPWPLVSRDHPRIRGEH